MTPAQTKGRAELEATLGRPDSKAVENGILGLLQVVLETKSVGSRPGDQEESVDLPPSRLGTQSILDIFERHGFPGPNALPRGSNAL